METSFRLFVKVKDPRDCDIKGEYRLKFRENDGNEFGDYGDMEWTEFNDDGSAELGTSIREADIPEAVKFLEGLGGYGFTLLKTTTEEIPLDK